MQYIVEPIGFVRSERISPEDDFWGGGQSEVTLLDSLDESALDGLEGFSHVEIVFLFHLVNESKIVTGSRYPRNNAAWPKVGIFAQRGKNRPNRIGSTICQVVSIDKRTLKLKELDAIDGTPVLDIKPVLQEFLPRQPTRQPVWATELMGQYWLSRK